MILRRRKFLFSTFKLTLGMLVTFWPLCCFALYLLLVVNVSLALDQEGGTSVQSPTQSGMMSLTDDFQSLASRKIIELSNRVDELFGTERLDEEASQSRGRVRVGAEINEGQGFDLRQGVNLALELPKTENRLQLILSSTFEGQDASPVGDGIQVPSEQDVYASGLRYFLFSDGPGRLNFDGGMKWKGTPSPFGQLRFRYIFTYRDWAITPTQFLFYRRNDGELGESTRLYFDRQLTENTLLRLRTEATLSQGSDGLEYSQTGTSYIQENDDSGYVLSAYFYGATGQPKNLEVCQLSGLYRRRLNREWLFLQVGPLVTFEEQRNWKAAPGALIQLEIFLGEIGDPIHLWR